MKVTENQFFFNNDNYTLFGVIYTPQYIDIANGKGIVICDPFGEEKLWAQRICVNFSRHLAKLGYTILRFDYMGRGDSDGDFKDATVRTRISDVKCAINYLKSSKYSLDFIGLIGLRFGATVAALAAEEDQNIGCLVLWNPITSGQSYINDLFVNIWF